MVSLRKRRALTAGLTAVAALAIAFAVYDGGSDDSPDAVASRFLAATRAGDVVGAFALFSEQTQHDLEAAAANASELVGGGRRFRATDMMQLGSVDTSGPPLRGELVEAGDARRVYRVRGAPGRADLSLVLIREKDAWRVDSPLSTGRLSN